MKSKNDEDARNCNYFSRRITLRRSDLIYFHFISPKNWASMTKFVVILIFIIPSSYGVPVPVNTNHGTENDHRCCSSFCDGMFVDMVTKSEDWFACHRGCQYFTLVQILRGEKLKDEIRISCHSGMFLLPVF